jgi:hypothetical protein
MDDFSIATADPGHFFGTLLSIGFGREVSLSQAAVSFVRSVCGELWNMEVFEKTLKHEEGEITGAELRARLEFLSRADGSWDSEIGIIASHFYELSVSDFEKVSPAVVELILTNPALVVGNEDSVFEVVHGLVSENPGNFGLLESVWFEYLSAGCMTRAFEFISSRFESLTFGIWSNLRTRLALSVTPSSQAGQRRFIPIDSRIISELPDIFSVFGNRRLRPLYRGSRDGFRAGDFHGRCDGRPNTVTLIRSANDCVFGGYTPLMWNSRNDYAPDPSLKSFVFTIKNPHNVPARRFAQKSGDYAIRNYHGYGPGFGRACDFLVYDECQSSANNYSQLGTTYVNDTGIPGDQVLTGSHNFTVKEIEVFEVMSEGNDS